MYHLNDIKSYVFDVNAFQVKAQYFETDIQNIFLPLLSKIATLKKSVDERVIVYLAAPPGVGKTTLSLLLEHLSKNDTSLEEIQAIGIDGFHYPQKYLNEHTVKIDGAEVPMKDVKGSPETFDLELLRRKIADLKDMKQEVKWPIYDRVKHDVVPEQILIEKRIVILEGNWLLLNEDHWKTLNAFCDYSVFITAQEEMLKTRLIERKIKGGLSEVEAIKFYERSDRKNVERVLEKKIKPDLELEVTQNGKYNIRR